MVVDWVVDADMMISFGGVLCRYDFTGKPRTRGLTVWSHAVDFAQDVMSRANVAREFGNLEGIRVISPNSLVSSLCIDGSCTHLVMGTSSPVHDGKFKLTGLSVRGGLHGLAKLSERHRANCGAKRWVSRKQVTHAFILCPVECSL
jgi:hypothetical protein